MEPSQVMIFDPQGNLWQRASNPKVAIMAGKRLGGIKKAEVLELKEGRGLVVLHFGTGAKSRIQFHIVRQAHIWLLKRSIDRRSALFGLYDPCS